ncbi:MULTISPECIES: NaeI family type II restriction endonuclease [Streptomyces]|uniref:NaeI family type II restriction endonuclease n=1 Tax=Streptomyces edwardsiae TaxID=3075527 RepID=A0ABU2PZ28_9ACTN|nr:NaeI family type II restriction endonuclease [Streptomyces sp. DSM 41636]MDT0397405.1 NaeI family type II restriction endonuclease [Streptomyces sp. DSM 41636]
MRKAVLQLPSKGEKLLPFDEDAITQAATRIAHKELDEQDLDVKKVADYIYSLDPDGNRFAAVLRDTIDQLLNGEATGRYAWKQLFKTEKTHAGTLVEINLQREFKFADGGDVGDHGQHPMDYRILGIDVDCKFSQDFGGWMIPPEAMGHLCLLVWADDYQSHWSAGIFRVRKDWLNVGSNRDKKLTLKAEHREDKVHWLWRNAPLPENVLLHLPEATRNQILIEGPRKGQRRVIELFRRVQNRRIGRGSVRTAAQQLDYMARLREGAGRARTVLREEGIVIVGPYSKHQEIARQIGAEVPQRGEFVSFRVTEAMPHHGDYPHVELEGRRWVLAGDADPVMTAPRLPRVTGEEES